MKIKVAATMAIAALLVLVAGAASAGADEVAPIAAALLPSDLSPWGMFLSADNFVKGVMVLLALASVVTWTAALARSNLRPRKLAGQIRLLERASNLGEPTPRCRAAAGWRRQCAKREERSRPPQISTPQASRSVSPRDWSAQRRNSVDGSRARSAFSRLPANGAVRRIVRHCMGRDEQLHRHIQTTHDQSGGRRAGIAEALLATALGLAAAIPAVVFYNMLARAIAGCRARYADGAAAILRLASRDLDRAQARQSPRVRSSAAE